MDPKCMANCSLTKQERISNRKKTVSLDSNMQKNDPGPLSYTIHKNKLKMDERPKCKTENNQNPRGENRQQPLWPRPQQLLDTSLEARETKAKMNYWGLIKTKTFCTVKKTINKTKRQPMEMEKILAHDISDKDQYQKFIKNWSKSTPPKQTIQWRTG